MYMQLHARWGRGASGLPGAVRVLGNTPPERCPVCEHRFCICPEKSGKPQLAT